MGIKDNVLAQHYPIIATETPRWFSWFLIIRIPLLKLTMAILVLMDLVNVCASLLTLVI